MVELRAVAKPKIVSSWFCQCFSERVQGKENTGVKFSELPNGQNHTNDMKT